MRKKKFKNILGQGENAGNHHFLHFPQCFIPFPTQIPIFHLDLICHLQMLSITTLRKKPFENTVGQGEKTFPTQIPIFHLDLSSANAFNLDQTEI